MRLINVKTGCLEDFQVRTRPDYAILSHRWSYEEVSLQDYQSSGLLASLAGHAKIDAACRQTQKRGISYLWVDTCCIDKTSSAELSESINSMFQWYADAQVCFAYLADIEPNPLDPSSTFIGHSEWLTRGWTLQELLAPSRVEFYAKDWTYISSRHDLADDISKATGISPSHLLDLDITLSRQALLFEASMAERMSWAASRRTTREEDMAYCLLGLFGVNMPLLYGEGANAFIRLQEEILRHNFDPTLLAWNCADACGLTLPQQQDLEDGSKLRAARRCLLRQDHPWHFKSIPGRDTKSTGVLAPGPKYFAECQNLVPCAGQNLDWHVNPKGLQLRLPLSGQDIDTAVLYLVLPCHQRHDPARMLAIPVVLGSTGSFRRVAERCIRVHHHKWHHWRSTTITMTTQPEDIRAIHDLPTDKRYAGVWVRSLPPGFKSFVPREDAQVEYLQGLLPSTRSLTPPHDPHSRQIKITVRSPDGHNFVVTLRSRVSPLYSITPTDVAYITIAPLGKGELLATCSDFAISSRRILAARVKTKDMLGSHYHVIDVHFGISRLGQIREALRLQRLGIIDGHASLIWKDPLGALGNVFDVSARIIYRCRYILSANRSSIPTALVMMVWSFHALRTVRKAAIWLPLWFQLPLRAQSLTRTTPGSGSAVDLEHYTWLAILMQVSCNDFDVLRSVFVTILAARIPSVLDSNPDMQDTSQASISTPRQETTTTILQPAVFCIMLFLVILSNLPLLSVFSPSMTRDIRDHELLIASLLTPFVVILLDGYSAPKLVVLSLVVVAVESLTLWTGRHNPLDTNPLKALMTRHKNLILLVTLGTSLAYSMGYAKFAGQLHTTTSQIGHLVLQLLQSGGETAAR